MERPDIEMPKCRAQNSLDNRHPVTNVTGVCVYGNEENVKIQVKTAAYATPNWTMLLDKYTVHPYP